MDSFDREEVKSFLDLGEQELYGLLVPERARQQLNSPGALMARGKNIFLSRASEVRSIVCRQYKQRGTSMKNTIDLTVLVATALLASPAMLGIPVLPMAALLVKIGLEEFCRSVTPEANPGHG
ncbi:MAG TPA: hypothetical protein VOA87_22645 [Thermoanaerobaculia bacterium]|nr:hypothetical protein [Thermoanaerobaculia bacterium]